jgi:hypothetical protein
MKYRPHLSSEAQLSIEEQMIWFEDGGGDELADEWLASLRETLDKLADHHERNGFAPENGRWMPNIVIRQKRFRPRKSKPGWRVLSTTNDSELTATIRQIRHERPTWMRD